MKKIFLALAALAGTMSMNAQIVKIMKGGEVVASYTAEQVDSVVFAEEPAITTGTAKRTGDIEVAWVQLWKNGPKFAEYNVGATNNKAEDYGGYYCWGGSIDKDSNAAYKSGTDPLTGTDDTATNLWGSNWRMPTKAELDDLLANCDVVWTTVNGVKGHKYTGKGNYASNSVFLPAAGFYFSGDVNDQGNFGYIWPSTPGDSGNAYYLLFGSGKQKVADFSRDLGFSVRAVLVENSAATSYNEGPITIGDGSGIELGEENW